jgi:hypothetical protein
MSPIRSAVVDVIAALTSANPIVATPPPAATIARRRVRSVLQRLARNHRNATAPTPERKTPAFSAPS